jgi:hypothetical protein
VLSKIIFIKRLILGGILFRDFILVPIRNGSYYTVLIFCTMKESEDKKKFCTVSSNTFRWEILMAIKF